MREMDDDEHSKSDDVDTQRLCLKVTLRVVSTVYPRDRTVTQLLHNNPINDELTGNLGLAEIDLTSYAPLILQRLGNALLTTLEDVILRFFSTMAAITCLTIERAPDTLAQLYDLPRRSTARCSSSTPSPI